MRAVALSLLCLPALLAGAGVRIERITVEDAPQQAQPSETGLLVATPWLPLFYLASTLAEGTSIHTAPMPACEAGADAVEAWCRDQPRSVDAVITIAGAWHGDHTFQGARRANVRVIEIDATTPVDGRGRAIPLQAGTRDAAKPPLLWLSPENLVTMANLIAADLARLSPPDATAIHEAERKVVVQLNELARFAARESAEVTWSEVADLSGGQLTPWLLGLGLQLVQGASSAEAVTVGLAGETGEINGICNALQVDSWAGMLDLIKQNYEILFAE